MVRVLDLAGFSAPHVPERQAEPDPDFPTVAFPNPEEPGAMDLALAVAADVGADIVVANDPDADRCAVGRCPTPHGLADAPRRRGRRPAGPPPARERQAGRLRQSIVSSSLLGKMAAAAGQPHQETLTGFKWIGRIPGLAFGYEEALGYCVDPAHVGDKDGISAALMVCELAATVKAQGRTLRDVLDDIARSTGCTPPTSSACASPTWPRSRPRCSGCASLLPTSLGGLAVERVDDLSLGSADLPPTDGLRYALADHARVIVRPSGTEAKVKCYLEVIVPVQDSDDEVDAARIAAVGRLDAIRADVQKAAGL